MSSDQRKIVVGILTVSLLASIIYFISSCGCNVKKSEEKEHYGREYTGLNRNDSYLYRQYAATEDEQKNENNRCQFCKGYNNYSFEAFENNKNNNDEFKLCPHNSREYGVALCNSQGKMM